MECIEVPRPGRPRISSGIHESKTLALYNAGRALLADQDYEAFSVAQLAQQSGCSVGAFYVRFLDKNAFLSFVVGTSFTFAARSFADAVTKSGIRAISTSAKARLAVSSLTAQFADEEFAGVVRAAVKLGFSEPRYRAPLDEYRSATAAFLVHWLMDGRSKYEAQVRAALQIIFGTLIDGDLKEPGGGIVQSASLQSAFVFLLESAVSGSLKLSGKIDNKAPPQKASKKPQPVSSLKKPAEKSAPKLKKAPGSNRESAKFPSSPRSSPVRKI